jgi:hypothetical protein
MEINKKTNFSSTHEFDGYNEKEIDSAYDMTFKLSQKYNIDIKVEILNDETYAIIINPLNKEVGLENYKGLTTELFSNVPEEIEEMIKNNGNTKEEVKPKPKMKR